MFVAALNERSRSAEGKEDLTLMVRRSSWRALPPVLSGEGHHLSEHEFRLIFKELVGANWIISSHLELKATRSEKKPKGSTWNKN